MQMRQFRSHYSQPHPARSELVTGGAAELLEALSPSTLRGRALILAYLGDDTHRLQRGDASFKSLRPFLALVGEAELALLADSVAILATMSIEEVLRELLLTFPVGDHPVQRGGRRLRKSRPSHDADAKQNDRKMFHDLTDYNPASARALDDLTSQSTLAHAPMAELKPVQSLGKAH